MKKILIAICAACLLASCAGLKSNSWMDPAFAGRTMGKTMVLGVAESDSLTRQYEALFVERLNEVGVDATSLHAQIGDIDRLSEEALAATLLEHRFDSILVTRNLSETERQQVVTTGCYPEDYGSYYGYYSYAYTLTYSTATVQGLLEFELETNLYDVKTRKLVWTGRKVVYDNRSDLSNMKAIIKEVVKELGKKGLL